MKRVYAHIAALTAAGFLIGGTTLRSVQADEPTDAIARYLSTIGTNDIELLSQNKLDQVSESHAEGVVVTWPDGHQTRGIQKHMEDIKAVFGYAPDIRITKPTVKFGSGEWTCVKASMTGTFTRPMVLSKNKIVHPTGKRFEVPLAIIGQWKEGKLTAEWLFWDNQTFMRQVGLPSSTSAYPSPS